MKRKFVRHLSVLLLATIIMVASARSIKVEAKICLIHSWNAATCTEPKTCAKCGKTSGSALGHDKVWYVLKANTCTTTGTRVQKCSRCNKEFQRITTGKLAHTYNVSAATCTTAKKCTVCGTVAQAALGHSYNISAATCTTAKRCTRSGCGYVAQAARGHSYNVSAATCTTDKKCTRTGCGHVAQAALGHSYNISAATCTTAKKCTRSGCGYVAQAALGHSYNVSAATCTVAKRCTRSGCSYVAQAALGHNKQYSYTEPTCETAGLKITTCSRTGCSLHTEDLNKNPLGHVQTVLTAKADGTLSSKCGRANCGKTYSLGAAPKKPASTYTSNIKIVLNDIVNGTSDLLTIGSDECQKMWSWYYNKNSSSTSAWCGATTAYLMSVAGLNTNKVQAMAETDASSTWALTNVGYATYFYQRSDSGANNNCFYPLPGYTSNTKVTTSNRGSFSNIKTGDLLMVDNGSSAFGHIGIAYVASDGKKYIIHGNWGNKVCKNEIKEDSAGKVHLYYGTSAGESISGYADIEAFISNNNLGVMYSLSSSANIPKYTIGTYNLGGYTR